MLNYDEKTEMFEDLEEEMLQGLSIPNKNDDSFAHGLAGQIILDGLYRQSFNEDEEDLILKKDIRKHSQGVVGGTYKPTNRLMMHSEVVADDDTKRFSSAV